jgi:hypothetical protein
MEKSMAFACLALCATFYAHASLLDQNYATDNSAPSSVILTTIDGETSPPQNLLLKRFEDSIEGNWQALDTAGQSIFGSIQFQKKTIQWGGGKISKCSTGYEILSESEGGQIPSYYNSPRTYRQGTTFLILKVKILNNHCARTARYLEIARPSNYDTIEVIPFDNSNEINGLLLFSKSWNP